VITLEDALDRVQEFVDSQPEWLRPGLYGASFIYLFMALRGGLILAPLLLVVIAVIDPHAFLYSIVPVFFFLAPASGFLGGLAYTATGPLFAAWGRVGRVLRVIAGTWVYCALLVFVISPVLDPEHAGSIHSSEDWMVASALGVFFGLLLGVSMTYRLR